MRDLYIWSNNPKRLLWVNAKKRSQQEHISRGKQVTYRYHVVLTNKERPNPFAKAAYMMFMVSEIHPFLDGNGRIARVMMNAELVKAEQTRIIIPTVYRDDYLGALRRLTRQQDPLAYIKMLQRAQDFSAILKANNMEELELQLESSNAFKEHNVAKSKIIP